MKHTVLLLLLLPSLLCSCSSARFNDQRVGACNELKSEIVFDGSTSNTREAEIENAEKPLAESTYDKRCE